MTDEELRQMRHIRESYGDLISAAAERHGLRSEVVAGIVMRESGGGLSKWLDKPGPEGRGDGGHGHGLMQIDDRFFKDFCAGEHWKDPAGNIGFGAALLSSKRASLMNWLILSKDAAERPAIAAYNCGEGNVRKAIDAGADVDLYTTGHDYSRAVLAYAEAYRGLAAAGPPPGPGPAPKPQPPQAASVGL